MSKDILSEPWVIKVGAAVTAHAAAFAGAVMSLAFVGQLSLRGRVVAVLVGFVTAVFGSPFISGIVNHLIFGGQMADEIRSSIMFFTSLSAMTVLPPLLKWAQRVAGDPLGVLSSLLPRGTSGGGEGGA